MRDGKRKIDGVGPVAVLIICTGIVFSWVDGYENTAALSAGEDVAAVEIVEIANEEVPLSSPEIVVPRWEMPQDERVEDYEYLFSVKDERTGFYLAELYSEDNPYSFGQILMEELEAKETTWFDGIYTASRAANAKLVSILYEDGDGNPQTAVSNTEEILAMASVYSKACGITDLGEIRSYVNELWKESHGYEISQSDLYYCTECMHEDDNENGGMQAVFTPADAFDASRDSMSGTEECPGHVNLSIRASIHTFSGVENLYSLDRIGAQAVENGIWDGWTEENRAHAEELCGQSWYQEHGLHGTITEIKRPLNDVEIETFMGMLDGVDNEKRRNVVQFALGSVGRVQYYWGGKPSGSNYGNDRFAVSVEADSHGRTTRGLDCSGWISWVYWSGTGKRLPFEGTDGLCSLGTPVDVTDLRAGDLAITTGEDSHVVMYLGKTPDGRLLCVHESSYAGTVAVSEMSTDWGYYRNLLG